jgi:hypothetical protein
LFEKEVSTDGGRWFMVLLSNVLRAFVYFTFVGPTKMLEKLQYHDCEVSFSCVFYLYKKVFRLQCIKDIIHWHMKGKNLLIYAIVRPRGLQEFEALRIFRQFSHVDGKVKYTTLRPPLAPVFKGKTVQERASFWTLENKPDK